ncbi:MAG: SDR family oxidoreductase [Oscillospiraceae bacterium]|jgi:NAD(P)-dependent dehydrogenase (short-subunit alcohol dehydrogenase family)|nr:SDR family oxidoreductase [Oscillospiraceae bacterium]
MARVVLVAGASSGLGRAVARELALGGDRVYAGARTFAAMPEIAPEGCLPVALDVTDAASVQDAVAQVLQAEGRIDALVNCAAVLSLGSCEETDDATLRRVLETNFIGMTRMTRAVLPAMRRQGCGRVVQFSSINGLLAVPFQGAYTAAKHALEGWNETLAMEAGRLGVKITLVEPGDCRGGSMAYRGHLEASEAADSPYRAAYRAAVAAISRDEAGGLSPETVAKAVARLLGRRHPPLRLRVARIDQRLAVWLHDLLPGRLFGRILARYYGAQNPPKEA